MYVCMYVCMYIYMYIYICIYIYIHTYSVDKTASDGVALGVTISKPRRHPASCSYVSVSGMPLHNLQLRVSNFRTVCIEICAKP